MSFYSAILQFIVYKMRLEGSKLRKLSLDKSS